MARVIIGREDIQAFIEAYVLPNDPHSCQRYTGDLRTMPTEVVSDMLGLSPAERTSFTRDDTADSYLIDTEETPHFIDMGGRLVEMKSGFPKSRTSALS